MKDLAGHPMEVAQELAKLDRQTQFAVIEKVLGDHSVCKSFLGATGRLVEPPPRDIVIMGDGSAPGPVLRRISQPMIDTIILPANVPLCRYSAFVDCRKFEDGSQKTRADTNMWQNGSLGYPLEFDLRWIELHFDDAADAAAARLVLSHMYVSFYFGCNVPWLRISGSAWKPLVGCPQHPVDPRYTSPEKFSKAVADEVLRRGGIWSHYWTPIGDPQGFRRVSSTESFHMQVEFDEHILLAKPMRLKLAMQDTLYTNL